MESWETLGDDAKSITTSRYALKCRMGELLTVLPTDAKAAIQAVLDDDAISGTAIAKALSRRVANPPKPFTINRHRRGDCTCGKAD